MVRLREWQAKVLDLKSPGPVPRIGAKGRGVVSELSAGNDRFTFAQSALKNVLKPGACEVFEYIRDCAPAIATPPQPHPGLRGF